MVIKAVWGRRHNGIVEQKKVYTLCQNMHPVEMAYDIRLEVEIDKPEGDGWVLYYYLIIKGGKE